MESTQTCLEHDPVATAAPYTDSLTDFTNQTDSVDNVILTGSIDDVNTDAPSLWHTPMNWQEKASTEAVCCSSTVYPTINPTGRDWCQDESPKEESWCSSTVLLSINQTGWKYEAPVEDPCCSSVKESIIQTEWEDVTHVEDSLDSLCSSSVQQSINETRWEDNAPVEDPGCSTSEQQSNTSAGCDEDVPSESSYQPSEEHTYNDSYRDDNCGSNNYNNVKMGQEDESSETDSDEEYTDSDEEYARAWNGAEFQNLLSRLRTMGTNNNEGIEAEMYYINPDYLSYEQLTELGETIGTVSKGLPSHIIESLPLLNYMTHDVEDGSIDQCVICLVDYENEEELTVLQCKHPYHPDCIKKWLQTNKTCPICNSDVSLSS